MALDERARHELFLRLEAVLGPAQAETLMEMMPPVGWADVATNRDVAGLKRDLDALEQRVDLRFQTMEHRLLAAFRGELLAAVTTQTRTLVMANLGALVSTAAIAFGAAKLL